MEGIKLSQQSAQSSRGGVCDEGLDVSGVRASDAVSTQSELFTANQDLNLQQNNCSVFSPSHPGLQLSI